MSKQSRYGSFPTGPVLVGTLLVCAGVFVMLWQRARKECRTNDCIGNMHTIGFFLRNYHGSHGIYPPSSDEPAAADPAVSWRVLTLLPSFPDLSRYNLAEPWNSQHNKQFITAPYSKSFSCPSDCAAKNAGKTAYLAVVGEGTVWSEIRLGHVRYPDKEMPGKIVVIEVPDSGVYWTEPRDITVAEATSLFLAKNGLRNSRHRKGLHYLTADGRVHSFDEISGEKEFLSLLKTTE